MTPAQEERARAARRRAYREQVREAMKEQAPTDAVTAKPTGSNHPAPHLHEERPARFYGPVV